MPDVMEQPVTRPSLRDPSLLVEANLVGGQWIQAADGATIPVHNPADGSLIGRVPALEPTRVEPVTLSLRTSGLPRRHR